MGFDWCIECVRASTYTSLASELQITKAMDYLLRQRDFQRATETLKAFEKTDTNMNSTAATNLAFLYFLEGETTQVYSEINTIISL